MVGSGPLVSIGCAVYNGESLVDRALSALLAQDYDNIEIIISDDASTDRTAEICASYARRDPRVKVLRNETNIGLTQNFNRLFAEARGKYFMWADQDDIRLPGFVSKAVAALEADPEAVLCHSHSGIFYLDPGNITAEASLDGVAEHRRVIPRYVAFLRQYTDLAIYGLILASALRRTHLWRSDLASGNALAFELLLQGPFLQTPEVLHLYSGRGFKNRPSPQEEYRRQNSGRPMPTFYFPFLVLASNQTSDILGSRQPIGTRVALVVILWSNVAIVNFAKLLYRMTRRLLGRHVPGWFATLMARAVGSTAHIRHIGDPKLTAELYPPDWDLEAKPYRARSSGLADPGPL